MKLFTLTALSLPLLCLPATAATFLVDFGNGSTTAATTTDTYNTLANQVGGNAATPLGLSSNGPGPSNGSITDAALEDSTGVTTGVGVSLSAYTLGGGQLRSNNFNTGGFANTAGAGVEAFATEDGYWVNNHNGNGTGVGNEFGMVITFSGLTDPLYDVTVLSTSTNHPGSWSVTTGTGDPDVEIYTGSASSADWTSVAPVGGVITLTSISNPPNSTFENMAINFASITAVPEPGSAALVGMASLSLLLRRRRR